MKERRNKRKEGRKKGKRKKKEATRMKKSVKIAFENDCKSRLINSHFYFQANYNYLRQPTS